MRRLDRLREKARDVGKVLQHWWFWHIEDVVLLGIGLVLLLAIMAAIFCSADWSRRYQKIHDKRTVVRSFSDGRFEYVEIDGHEYLLWNDASRGGITHSPKCKCIQKDAPHEQ